MRPCGSTEAVADRRAVALHRVRGRKSLPAVQRTDEADVAGVVFAQRLGVAQIELALGAEGDLGACFAVRLHRFRLGQNLARRGPVAALVGARLQHDAIVASVRHPQAALLVKGPRGSEGGSGKGREECQVHGLEGEKGHCQP
jgi:hypothetical protein